MDTECEFGGGDAFCGHRVVTCGITLLFGAIAGWLLGLIGTDGSFWSQWYGQILSAVIGAVVLIWVWNLIRKAVK